MSASSTIPMFIRVHLPLCAGGHDGDSRHLSVGRTLGGASVLYVVLVLLQQGLEVGMVAEGFENSAPRRPCAPRSMRALNRESSWMVRSQECPVDHRRI
jgi:hypothetical protein